MTQATGLHFWASVGCRWSSRSRRATWERLEGGLGLGQHLPAVIVLSAQLLDLSVHVLGCCPGSLSSFLLALNLLSVIGSASPQILAHVLGHLLIRVQHLIGGVHASPVVEMFLLHL